MAPLSQMSETIFWDTAAYIALSNKSDSLHDQAIEISNELATSEAHILTTDAVLIEVANAFSDVPRRAMAQRIIDAIYRSQALNVAILVHIDKDLWQRGWRLFSNRPDKNWSLTDCISFVVMEDYKVIKAFTSDHHFEQAGFTRLLTP